MPKEKYQYILQKLKGGKNKKQSQQIDDFFMLLDQRIDLPAVRKNELIEHFFSAFDYYLDNNYSIDEIIKTISADNLGTFYQHNDRKYIPLDNAAIVYPLGMRFGKMPVFRLSVNLKEEVIPCLLQLALDFTIKRFPSFSAVIKTGVFWHYLETVNNIHLIEAEKDIPCRPISIILRSVKSFRVLYYKKRISVEFFHVISDATGGMVFLKTLVAEYLRLLGNKIQYCDGVLDVNGEVQDYEMLNEFNTTDANDDFNTFLDKKSLQLDGKLTKASINRVIHFQMNSKQLIDVAHRYNATVTSYLNALIFIACKRCISNKQGLINIQIPVNMRKFNNSNTLRNYSMYFSTSIDIDEIDNVEKLVKDINKQIKQKGNYEVMSSMMATTGKLIKMINYVPILLKGPIVKIVYGYLGNSIIAMTLSNLNVVKIPGFMKSHVESFDFVIAPYSPNRAACSVVSYNGKTRFTITKATKDSLFEKTMYELLKNDGIKIMLEGSNDYES